MFNLHDFVLRGLFDAIGKLPDYKVIMNALGWYEKEVLTDEDLEEINRRIEAQYAPTEGEEEWI